MNGTVASQNTGGNNRKKTLIVGDSIVKNIEWCILSKRMKSSVAVKSIPGAAAKGMKHHIKGCLEDNSADSIILHVGTNNLKSRESVEDIANDIMDVVIFIRNEKTNVFVSSLTIRNDRLNDKRKNVNSLLKRRCYEEKICFVDNTNINLRMLNNSVPQRKNRDKFGGELMFYVNEQIPSKVLSLESIPMDIELILLEFTAKNQRWLCVVIYRSPSQNEKYFIDHLSKTLGPFSCRYDKTNVDWRF